MTGKHVGALWPSFPSSETSGQTLGKASQSEAYFSIRKGPCGCSWLWQTETGCVQTKGFLISQAVFSGCFTCFTFQKRPLGTGRWVSDHVQFRYLFRNLEREAWSPVNHSKALGPLRLTPGGGSHVGPTPMCSSASHSAFVQTQRWGLQSTGMLLRLSQGGGNARGCRGQLCSLGHSGPEPPAEGRPFSSTTDRVYGN